MFRSVHGPFKMHFIVDNLGFSLAEPFSSGLRLIYTRELAQSGLASGIWR